jgi:hypothetical protein
MKQNFKFILVAAAAIAMVGCTNEKGTIEEPAFEQGSQTFATVRVEQKSATRAFADDDTNEGNLADARMLVFNAAGDLESVTELTVGGSTTISTFTGKHTIFVLANVPSTMDAVIDGYTTLAAKTAAENAGTPISTAATTLADFKGYTLPLATEAAIKDLSSATTNKFFMTNFGDEELVKTFEATTEENLTANDFTVELGRAVAKVSMAFITTDSESKNNVIQPTNGTLTTVSYKVMNNPDKMYVAQHFDGAVYKTPYHDNLIKEEQGVANWGAANYIETAYVSASSNLATPTSHIYVPENTNASTVKEGERTVLMIKGVFIAKEAYDGEGNLVEDYEEASKDLYRIYDAKTGQDIDKFYTTDELAMSEVRTALSLLSGQDDPVAYDATDEDADEPGEYDYILYFWEDGICYYRLPLENVKDGKPELGNPLRYNVRRNDWFNVNIDSVSDIGGTSEEEITPDPWTPVDGPVKINATITVSNWTPVTQQGNI